MSELMQFEMGMSTSLYLPAIGTAGFERDAVSGYSLDPCPPPKMIDKTLSLIIAFILRIYIILVLAWLWPPNQKILQHVSYRFLP